MYQDFHCSWKGISISNIYILKNISLATIKDSILYFINYFQHRFIFFRDVDNVLIGKHIAIHIYYIHLTLLPKYLVNISRYVDKSSLKKKRNIAGKLRFHQTWPREIASIPPRNVCILRHCNTHNTKDKQKATELSPYPLKSVHVFSC